MAVVFPQGIEVFSNAASCVATSTFGTTNPGAGATETWTVGTGSTSFPVANSTSVPATYFYVTDPADTTHEIILVSSNNSSGSPGTSWSVQRGMNGATVAHASGATYVQVISPFTLEGFKQTPGSVTSAVTVANTTTETVIATYLPQAADLVPGATWEIVAYGPWGKANGSGLVLTWRIYWGGSGSVGGAFTATGSALLGMMKAGTNATALGTTIIAGASYDINAQVTWLSSTTAHCQINWWYNNAANLTTTNVNAQTTNTNSSTGASQVGPVTISGNGPIILTVQWSGTGAPSVSDTVTAVAPFIYRQA